jgi:rod shape-determining protein MreD
MIHTSLGKTWGMRAGFMCIILGVLFGELLPLQTTAPRWAGPDLIMGFACAWSLRRPDYVPFWGLALLFLLTDFLLGRPPGLWAALMLIGCKSLQSRSRFLRTGGFLAEWAAMALVAVFVLISYRMGLALVLLPTPHLPLQLVETGATIAVYPLVAGLSHMIIGGRRALVEPGGRP